VSVIAEAAGVVPMSRLPMPEMAAEMVTVPTVVMHGEVVAVVMAIMMPMHIVMAEMIEAVTEKSVAEAMPAAAFGGSVDLSQRDCEQTGRNGGDYLSRKHQMLRGRSQARKAHYPPSRRQMRRPGQQTNENS
jgi:hypothetical protein